MVNCVKLSVTPKILIFFSRLNNRLEQCLDKTSIIEIIYINKGTFKF